MRKLAVLAVAAVVCLAGAAYGQGYTLLHEFNGLTGASPRGSLVSDGSALYGITYDGGNYYGGAVFSLKPDGSGFTLLHSFPSFLGDGIEPQGSLLVDGSTLYGMTTENIPTYEGTIFSIKPDGSNYTILHTFDGFTGASPTGNLISDGSKFYGMTYSGGTYNSGTVFSINKDGTSHNVLHDFNWLVDGSNPYGSLLSDGSALYGMVGYGPGYYGRGTIFSLKLDGSGYTLLHEFDGVTGASPRGSLIADGSTLYGMTTYGGSSNFYYAGTGTIFSMNNDGTGYTLLHEFSGGAQGWIPWGSLLSEDNRLFGMTAYGGTGAGGYGLGTVFSIRPDGSNFTLIRSFTGGPKDGSRPFDNLISDGTTLYGMTTAGGQYYQSGYGGTIFSMPIPTPAPTATPTPLPGLMDASIWVDKDEYTFGETQVLSYELINPLHAFSLPVDAYLALEAPDGRVFFYGPRELGRGLQRFTVAPVPVTTIGRVASVLSGTAAQFTVPPLQQGTWTWMGVLVPHGANPANPADRISNLATDTFEFTQ